MTLERREGRWQWTDVVAAAALPLVAGEDAELPSAAPMGQAAFNPFAPAEVSAAAGPLPADGSILPGPGWLWLVPAAAVLGIVTWRRRPVATADPGLVGGHAVTVDAAVTGLARLMPAPADEHSQPRATVADSEAAPAVFAEGQERARPAPPDDVPPLSIAPPDDLKRIKGIGPALERHLHEQGVFHLRQIAQWQPADVAEFGARLRAFKGRIERDRWVAQAIELSR